MFVIKTHALPAAHLSAYAMQWIYDHASHQLSVSSCVLFIPLRGYNCD